MKQMLFILGLVVFGFSLQAQAATYNGALEINSMQPADTFSVTNIAANSAVDDTLEFTFSGFPSVLSISNTLPQGWNSFSISLWDNAGFVGAALASASGTVGDIAFQVALNAGTYFFHVQGETGSRLGTYQVGVYATPIPAAIWLFGSALMGLVGFSRRKGNSAQSVA